MKTIIFLILAFGLGMVIMRAHESEDFQNSKRWYKNPLAVFLSFCVCIFFPACAVAVYSFSASFYLPEGIISTLFFFIVGTATRVASVPMGVWTYYIICNHTIVARNLGAVLYGIYCVLLGLSVYTSFVTGQILDGCVWMASLAISFAVLLRQLHRITEKVSNPHDDEKGVA